MHTLPWPLRLVCTLVVVNYFKFSALNEILCTIRTGEPFGVGSDGKEVSALWLQGTPLKPCATHVRRATPPNWEGPTPPSLDAPAVLAVSGLTRVPVATVQMAHTPFGCRNTHGMTLVHHLAQQIVCEGGALEFGVWRSPAHPRHVHLAIWKLERVGMSGTFLCHEWTVG